MSNDKLGTLIHGIGSHSSIDTAGERMDIDGIDISSLPQTGTINTEHEAKTTTQTIGKILEAKKILKKDDCDNKHHEYFWDKANKMPYLYIKAVLFDNFGHQGAKDAVATLKFDKALDTTDTKPVSGFSIEGSKIDKKGNIITKSLARKVSWTITPANKACIAEILEPEDSDTKEINLMDIVAVFKKCEADDMEALNKNILEKEYLINPKTLEANKLPRLDKDKAKKAIKDNPIRRYLVHGLTSNRVKELQLHEKEVRKSLKEQALQWYPHKKELFFTLMKKHQGCEKSKLIDMAQEVALVAMKKAEDEIAEKFNMALPKEEESK
jgi:hypothetical protein